MGGNYCKGCGGYVHKGKHVMNCRRCSWWLCSECNNHICQGSAEDGQPLEAADDEPSHASAGDKQALQEWNDQEYEMFVQALCASLADMEPDSNSAKFSDEEDEMLALALSASPAGQEALQGGFEEQ